MKYLLDWARKELALGLCDSLNQEPEGEWNYKTSCYEVAEYLYEKMFVNDPQGYGLNYTMDILQRLVNSQPLTPIEDEESTWVEFYTPASDNDDDIVIYQCARMPYLLKYLYFNGKVEYEDLLYTAAVNIADSSDIYSSAMVNEIVSAIFPIQFPYYPEDPILVYCSEFKLNGSTYFGILYADKPKEARHEINRFFKSFEDNYVEVDELDFYDAERLSKGFIYYSDDETFVDFGGSL